MAIDWDRRIARAGELAVQHPAAAEMLRFYVAVAGFQKQVYLLAPPDIPALALLIPELRCIVSRAGPPELAGCAISERQIEAFWRDEELDPAEAFFARVLLEPYSAQRSACPFCGRKPQAAVLRPEGHGAKRSLLCALCSSEWPFPRVQCPACGEREFDRLPVYTAPEFHYIRIDACDSCRMYLKTIDLTKNGLAVPVVDELASISLDLWAVDHGYTKLRPNLLAL